jgi:hypothetical protein
METHQISGGEGSGSDFVAHWDWAASKGLLNRNTASALKAASSRILRIEGDNWETMDVRSIDADSLLDRFENLAKKDYTPDSLTTYRSRFKKALALYLSYLRDPRGYRPQGRERSLSVDRIRAKAPAGRPARLESESTSTSHLGGELTLTPGVRLVRYPFPIREGVMGELLLPTDLRKDEVKRLMNFLDSIAVEPAGPNQDTSATDT